MVEWTQEFIIILVLVWIACSLIFYAIYIITHTRKSDKRKVLISKKTNEIVLENKAMKILFISWVLFIGLFTYFNKPSDTLDIIIVIILLIVFPTLFFCVGWGYRIYYNEETFKEYFFGHKFKERNVNDIEYIELVPTGLWPSYKVKFNDGSKIELASYFTSYDYIIDDLKNKIPESKWNNST